MRRKTICTVIALLLATFAAFSARGEIFVDREKPADWESRELLRVTVAGFPYNDAFLVECGGESLLIDGGVKAYRHRLMDYLRSRNLFHVTLIFSTHPHDDHQQGTYINIKLEGLTAEAFVSLFPMDYRNELQRKTVNALKETGIPYRQIAPETELSVGAAVMTVYQWPDGNDPNELSGASMLRFGGSTMFFGADLPGVAQHWFAEHYGPEVLKADILKVPHHGIVPMSQDFLEAVDPDFAILTTRKAAAEKTSKQLKNAGIPVVYNSVSSYILETDGTDWYITTEKDLI